MGKNTKMSLAKLIQNPHQVLDFLVVCLSNYNLSLLYVYYLKYYFIFYLWNSPRQVNFICDTVFILWTSSTRQLDHRLTRGKGYTWTVVKNWVFATNSNFLIPISLQSFGVNLWYWKLKLYNLTDLIVCNIYDIGLQRYRDYTIRVWGKDLIPLWITKGS